VLFADFVVLQGLLVIQHLACKDEPLVLWQQPCSSSSSSRQKRVSNSS
jgi:hypothetical protein